MMNKLTFALLLLCLSSALHSQVYKTVKGVTAGHLCDSIKEPQRSSITNLTVTGTIDARDFQTLRDSIPYLKVLDIQGTDVAAYSSYFANVIPAYAFYYKGLKSIKLPNSVTTIDSYAFNFCTLLDTVIFPEALQQIKRYTFDNCSSIKKIALPNSVTGLDYSSFRCCYKLKRISLPESLTALGEYTFFCCTSLDSVVIPSKITTIGKMTFGSCDSLKTISLPSSLKIIDQYSFDYCKSLKSITIPASVTKIGIYAFTWCTSLKNVLIQSSATTIGAYAFDSCIDLDSISIPSSVTLLDIYAFSGCLKLKKITLPPVTFLPRCLFNYCGKLDTIVIPPTVSLIDYRAFYFTSLKTLSLPSSVSIIAKNAFWGTLLKSVFIPSSVITIGENAFPPDCKLIVDSVNKYFTSEDEILYTKNKDTLLRCPTSKVGTVKLKETLAVIADSAFRNCKNIDTIVLPSTLKRISNAAFYGCSGLNELFVPASVTSIGKNALTRCSANIIVDLNNSRYASIDGILFNKALDTLIQSPTTKAGKYVVPSTVKVIGYCSFFSNYLLDSIIIPQSLNEIQNYAFCNCTKLTFIEVNNTVPPKISFASFDFSSNCRLNVPEFSNPTYKTTDPWLHFEKITYIYQETMLSVSNTLNIITNSSGSSTISIGANKKWMAKSNQNWIIISPADSIIGNYNLLITYTANPDTIERSGVITLDGRGASQTVTFTQQAKERPFLSATNTIVTVPDSTGIYKLNICSNTKWMAKSNQNWLTISQTDSTTGNATLVMTINANIDTIERIAKITVSAKNVNDLTISITQAAAITSASQTVTISPNTNQETKLSVSNTLYIIPSSAGSSTLSVWANKKWMAKSNQNWLIISPADSITGTNDLLITHTANPDTIERNGLITIEGYGASQTVTFTQQAKERPFLSVTNTIVIVSDSFKTYKINVNSNKKWVAKSNQSWLTLSPADSISGNAELSLTLSANTDTVERSAKITISAKMVNDVIINITQTASPKGLTTGASQTVTTNTDQETRLSVSNTLTIIPCSGGSLTLSISANKKWIASSNQNWLTISPTDSVIGNATLTLTFSANTDTIERIVNVRISAKNLTDLIISITQAASNKKDTVSTLNTNICYANALIEIFPNPISTGFYVKGLDKGSIQLFDINGNKVLSKLLLPNSYFSLPTIPSGTYIIRVDGDNIHIQRKLIKQ